MKRLLSVLFFVLALVSALVGADMGLLSEGVMNVGLFAGWCYALILLVAVLVYLGNDERLKQLAEKLAEKPKRPEWMKRIENYALFAIAPGLVFYGYWVTAILWTVVWCLAYLLGHELKKLEVTPAKDEQTA